MRKSSPDKGAEDRATPIIIAAAGMGSSIAILMFVAPALIRAARARRKAARMERKAETGKRRRDGA